MKEMGKHLSMLLCAGFLIVLSSGVVFSADTDTVIGTVNNAYQIVTEEGEIYEIAENEIGDQLVHLVGKIVRATGIVRKMEEGKMIIVMSYEILGEKT
jgi:hypothetical protein